MQEKDYFDLLEKEKNSKKKVRFERKAVWKDFRQSNFSLQLSPRTTNRDAPAVRPRSHTLPSSAKLPSISSKTKRRPQSFSHHPPQSHRQRVSGFSIRRWTSVDLNLQRKSRGLSRDRGQTVPKYSAYSSEVIRTNVYKSTSESGSDSDYSITTGASRCLSMIRSDKSSSDNESDGNNRGYRATVMVSFYFN